jgi:long-chain fatty acid transport protein
VVNAAGFAIIEHSASGVGNSFAGGAAIAEDASTVYFNPAGLTKLEGRQLTGAIHYINPKSKFTNEGSTTALQQPLTGDNDDGGKVGWVPNLYYVQDINEQWKFGLGINAPFGLTVEYDDDWVGRYHAVKSDVLSVNINPSLAFKANEKMSFGFGLSAQYIDVELTSAIDMGSVCLDQELGAVIPPETCHALGSDPQQNDGFAKLTADSWDFGYNFGFLYEFSPASRMGVHYRSKVNHTVEGDARFKVPGELDFLTATGNFVNTNISADVALPDSISLSYFQELNPALAIMFDWTLTRWSSFDELRIEYDSAQPDTVTTEDWDDSNRFSAGLNFRLNPQWLLRFGLAYDQTPIPNSRHRTPRLPGNDRTWASFGFNFQPQDNLSMDFGYAHLFIPDADINNTYESGVPTLAHTLSGSYELQVDIVSAQLNWKF